MGLLRSFRFAFRGLGQVLTRERNARVHLVAAAAALGLSLWLGLARVEIALVVLAIGRVLAAEVVNTVVERLLDRLHPAWPARRAPGRRARPSRGGAVIPSLPARAHSGGRCHTPSRRRGSRWWCCRGSLSGCWRERWRGSWCRDVTRWAASARSCSGWLARSSARWGSCSSAAWSPPADPAGRQLATTPLEAPRPGTLGRGSVVLSEQFDGRQPRVPFGGEAGQPAGGRVEAFGAHAVAHLSAPAGTADQAGPIEHGQVLDDRLAADRQFGRQDGGGRLAAGGKRVEHLVGLRGLARRPFPPRRRLAHAVRCSTYRCRLPSTCRQPWLLASACRAWSTFTASVLAKPLSATRTRVPSPCGVSVNSTLVAVPSDTGVSGWRAHR